MSKKERIKSYIFIIIEMGRENINDDDDDNASWKIIIIHQNVWSFIIIEQYKVCFGYSFTAINNVFTTNPPLADTEMPSFLLLTYYSSLFLIWLLLFFCSVVLLFLSVLLPSLYWLLLFIFSVPFFNSVAFFK